MEETADKARARPLLTVVAAVLVNAQGEILLAERPEGKAMAGLWEFPGGKIEAGETPEDALAREIYEELAIEIAAADLVPFTFASHSYEAMHLLMPLYLCRNWRGEIRPQENQKTAWVAPRDLGNYPMPPADLPLVKILQNGVGL